MLGFLSVTISIVGASILVGYFKMGIVGLCLGLMAGRAILSVGYPWLVSRLLGLPLSGQLKGTGRPVLVMILLFGLAFAVDNLAPLVAWPGADSWIGFFISAGLSGLLFVGLAFFLGLTTDQRAGILRRIRMVYTQPDASTIPLRK
jgi:hypothetical protein